MHFKDNIAMNHFKENITIYIFMTTLFLIGIIFGAIVVNSMTFIQKQDLYFHLERFLNQLNGELTFENIDILKRSFFYHVKYLLLLFLLGLTIIGLPIIWVLIFIKGLVVGFSVGFIVNQLGLNGLLIATLSIAPQNIIIIPVYIIAASLSMIFSLGLLYKIIGHSTSLSVIKPFMQYTFIFIILIGCAFISTLIETYVSNEALKAMLRLGYRHILFLTLSFWVERVVRSL